MLWISKYLILVRQNDVHTNGKVIVKLTSCLHVTPTILGSDFGTNNITIDKKDIKVKRWLGKCSARIGIIGKPPKVY